MYYHASPVGRIKTLEPRISNHGAPLVYFSKKRENTLVYLSNAVEKFCRETGFPHAGSWTTWGPYGFRNGILLLEEYYPNALEETYRGVSGYVYRAASIREADWADSIPDAAVSPSPWTGWSSSPTPAGRFWTPSAPVCSPSPGTGGTPWKTWPGLRKPSGRSMTAPAAGRNTGIF